MSEYVKVKRRIYDELVNNQVKYKEAVAKYEILVETLKTILETSEINNPFEGDEE